MTKLISVFIILRTRLRRVRSHNFAYLEIMTCILSKKSHKMLQCDLHFSLNIFRMTKCRGMCWVAHVAHLGAKVYPIYKVFFLRRFNEKKTTLETSVKIREKY
jgi:hypothetical protein